MVFDRRFTAASRLDTLDPTRTSNFRAHGLRPPLQDYYVLLTRSFLMVLATDWSGKETWYTLK